MNFHLSWNWGQELIRDHLSSLNEDLKAMIEEVVPFTSEFSYNLVTILDKLDTKRNGMLSEESILDRYHEATGRKANKTDK